MSKRIAAAVQFNPVHKDVEGNRARIVALAGEAADAGAGLIVFPEMATSGYVWTDREEISPYVEPIPGPTTNALVPVAKEKDCYVVIGLPEVDPTDNVYYNSAVLIGPEGVVGKYRKTHLFAADPRWAREGNDGFPVFETGIGRIGLLICMDAMYFEPARILALQDADVIAFPTNWVGNGNNPPSKTWCLRARENGVCWVAANRSDAERGAQFTGGSAIIGPDGVPRQYLVSGEGIVYGELLTDGAAKNRLRLSRKPEAYQEILLHPYLWKEGETYASSGEPATFTIAVLPLGNEGGPGRQIARHLAAIEPGNEQPVLAVVPEQTALNGDMEDYIRSLSAAAVDNGVYLAAAARGECFLLAPDGSLIGRSRQVHDCGGTGAERYRVFMTPFGRVGLLTETDAKYPESYRVLAKYGADIIAISGSRAEDNDVWMKRIWAFENDAILALARPGGAAASLLFLHRQAALESDDGTPLIQTFNPDMTAVARSRPFMRRMKTHLYDLLVSRK